MYRLNVRRATIACLGVLALLPFGCAAPGVEADTGTTQVVYPDWVSIVPEPTDEASYYVGAVSLARDVESGIEGAETDALDQAREGQRRYLIQRFDRAAAESGIETTSQERLELRTSIADEVARQVSSATQREDVYYRHCPGEGGAERQAVCEVFVLLRLDHSERDRILAESLAVVGESKQREGEANLAAVIEWVLRNP